MTKNRGPKKRRRATAQAAGTNYTSVLRTPDAANGADAGLSPSTLDWSTLVRTDLPWADVVLDARRFEEVLGDNLSEVLGDDAPWMSPGHPELPGSGVYEVLDDTGVLSIGVHILCKETARVRVARSLDEPRRRYPHGKPGVLLSITYPDGFRVCFLPPNNSTYGAGSYDVWHSFTEREQFEAGPLGSLVTTGGDIEPRRYPEHVKEMLAREGANGLRAAVENLDAWLPRSTPVEVRSGVCCWDIFDMFFASTSGFDDIESHRTAWELAEGAERLCAARVAGAPIHDEDALYEWFQAHEHLGASPHTGRS